MFRELLGEEHKYTKGVKQWLDGLSGKQIALTEEYNIPEDIFYA